MTVFTTILNLTATTSELEFEPQRFISSFKYMGKGMLVIFVIIGVIVLATTLINKISKHK